MFFLIGIGMSSPQDITLKGLTAIKKSEKVYLESYTSVLIDATVEDLEAAYGQPLVVADRDLIENEFDGILSDAGDQNISLLVVGDPFGATTHVDLILRCKQKGISCEVIHNVSILNAIGSSGINLYNFGQTVSIPFFKENWRPKSWLKKINQNFVIGLHTLCLLDIKVKEQSDENLARNRRIYEKPRFMTIPTAIEQIVSLIEEMNKQEALDDLNKEEEIISTEEKFKNKLNDIENILCIGACRLTAESSKFIVGSLSELSKLDPEEFGKPLHSLVILGQPHNLNPVEIEFLSHFAVDEQNWFKLSTGDHKQ